MMNQLLFGDANLKIDTEVREKKFAFKWIIQNISGIPDSVESMRFSLVGDETKDWYATATSLPDGKFSVSLTCDSENPIPVRIEHTSKAFNLELKSLGGISSSTLFFQKQGEEGILLDEVDCPDDTGDGKAIFECSMKVYGFDLNTTCEVLSAQDAEDMEVMDYQEGLRKLMNDKEYADLDIHCFGRCFPVHKCVLKFRAPVFFELHKDAIAGGKLVLNGIPCHIFKGLLVYIYTGGEEEHLLARDEYPDLYNVAHKYALEGLKRKCAKVMSEELTADSVVKVFDLAETLEDEQLMMQCRVFMRRHLEELSTKGDWKIMLLRRSNFLEDVMKVQV